MRRLLIVSPHFPPVNAPDMQRARLALPYLAEMGWEATVLAVNPRLVEGAVIDPLLKDTYPPEIPIIRVGGISAASTRWAGIGSLWWRCGRALRRSGEQLLAQKKFDLVFFSTTQFDAFTLGPRWLRQFGVPFVLDYQDPWVNDYYRQTNTRPPGGAFKFWVSQFTARRREGPVLRAAAGVVAVSASYGPALEQRYLWFDPARVTTIPFGAAAADLRIARLHVPIAPLVPFGDGRVHHVYTGRCGPDMTIALTTLFRAVAHFKRTHPTAAARHHFHFIGTDYAPPPLGKFWVLPVAEQEGVRDMVSEHCYRVPYFDALHYLSRADALVVLGSNDPTYSASKISPYLLANRPMLTLAHESSAMLTRARAQGHRANFGFSTTDSRIDANAAAVHDLWLVAAGYAAMPPGDAEDIERSSAHEMTRQLCTVFDRAISGPPLS